MIWKRDAALLYLATPPPSPCVWPDLHPQLKVCGNEGWRQGWGLTGSTKNCCFVGWYMRQMEHSALLSDNLINPQNHRVSRRASTATPAPHLRDWGLLSLLSTASFPSFFLHFAFFWLHFSSPLFSLPPSPVQAHPHCFNPVLTLCLTECFSCLQANSVMLPGPF